MTYNQTHVIMYRYICVNCEYLWYHFAVTPFNKSATN